MKCVMVAAAAAVLGAGAAAQAQRSGDAIRQAAPVESALSRERPCTMERTTQWTVKSKSGRLFEISLALPKGAAPASGYPVMYVLDADTSFATLVDTVRNQEQMFGPTVVVGIGYPSEAEVANRLFDFTPPTDRSTLPAAAPGGWGATGGADGFRVFLQDELKPMIEARVSVDRSRQALFGHSLGGLFVLHVLLTNPDAFNVYVAGSPSIWWGDRQILKEVAPFEAVQRRTGVRRRLLITVGGLETHLSPEELRASMAMKLPDPDAEFHRMNMVGNATEMAARLLKLSKQGLDVDFVLFPDETHNSVIPAYLGRGARFASSGW